MSMNNPNYTEVREALHHREDFTHGYSMSARRRTDEYVVWSYNTVILRYSLTAHEVTYFDNRRYSVTTSKQQGMVRCAFDVPLAPGAREVYTKGGRHERPMGAPADDPIRACGRRASQVPKDAEGRCGCGCFDRAGCAFDRAILAAR